MYALSNIHLSCVSQSWFKERQANFFLFFVKKKKNKNKKKEDDDDYIVKLFTIFTHA